MSTVDAQAARAPDLPGPPPAILIVRAPYYRAVVEGLEAGARRIGAAVNAAVEVADVAGAYELPQAIRLALRGSVLPSGRRFDGYVALGCVVKGETDHYHYLCRATMQGLMDVALQYGIALGAGLLTVHSEAQAVARSGDDGHNKGAEAMAACLVQIALARRFGAA
jgi:6,7-dimethyl-8-ribityllumazine synthase